MIPTVDYKPPISDLFANFFYNWDTLSPAINLLIGILFAFFLLRKIKEIYY